MSDIYTFTGTYSFLSNFYACNVEGYPTLEHAFQADKFRAYDIKQLIKGCRTPGEAKKLGKEMPARDEWEEVKLDVMLHLLREKFQQPALKDQLIATGDAKLIEGNTWHDNFWGSCTCEKCGNQGKNELGNMLMKVRNEISVCSGDDRPNSC